MSSTATGLRRRPTSKPREKTFSAFLHTTEGKRWCSPTIYSRLVVADIGGLDALLRWTRERYPKQYKAYSFMSESTGREMMQKLWAEYLKWSETEPRPGL